MRFVYPYSVSADERGFFQVRFLDVPEALSEGESEAAAHGLAADALIAALGAMVRLKRRLPAPSAARRRPTVTIPALQAAKLALHEAMLGRKISHVALARELGKQESEIRRMLDLDHETRIGTLEQALGCLGMRVEVAVREVV